MSNRIKGATHCISIVNSIHAFSQVHFLFFLQNLLVVHQAIEYATSVTKLKVLPVITSEHRTKHVEKKIDTAMHIGNLTIWAVCPYHMGAVGITATHQFAQERNFQRKLVHFFVVAIQTFVIWS